MTIPPRKGHLSHLLPLMLLAAAIYGSPSDEPPPPLSLTIHIHDPSTSSTRPLHLECPEGSSALSCSHHLCTTNNLEQTVEGLNCIEMVLDEIARQDPSGLPTFFPSPAEAVQYMYDETTRNYLQYTQPDLLNVNGVHFLASEAATTTSLRASQMLDVPYNEVLKIISDAISSHPKTEPNLIPPIYTPLIYSINDGPPFEYPSLPIYPDEHLAFAASRFCFKNRCADRTNAVLELMEYLRTGSSNIYHNAFNTVSPRIVVSLTSLPSRLEHLPHSLDHLLSQSRRPDHVYLNIPEYSNRQQIPYVIPQLLMDFLDTFPIPTTINRCSDHGPLTKLLPTLKLEPIPTTIIVTIDDDIHYPDSLISTLLSAALRYPNAAIGFKGYIIPQDSNNHDDFAYFESATTFKDTPVHVLGGFLGVAYRSSFFSIPHLLDPPTPGSYYVDDDFISLHLSLSGIPRIVLSSSNSRPYSDFVFNEAVIKPVADLWSLNGKRSFRNVQHQSELIDFARSHVPPLFQPIPSFMEYYDIYYAPLLGLRSHSFRLTLSLLPMNSIIAETGTTFGHMGWSESGQSTILFDHYVNYPEQSGQIFSVDLNPDAVAICNTITSSLVNVTASDSVAYLAKLNTSLDLLYLDSYDVSTADWETTDHLPALHALKELTAAFGLVKRPGGLILVDDNIPNHIETANDVRGIFRDLPYDQHSYDPSWSIRGKGRYVFEFMSQTDCALLHYGYQILWQC